MNILFLQLIISVILVLCPNIYTAKRNIIKQIPGYPNQLPFHLETGYVGVGEKEQVQLFYYFVESEGDPRRDPLLVWLTGGPGCSALSSFVLEIGPLNLNVSSSNWQSESPKFQLNPYSWTKVASIVFVDSPVGTGFSYATTSAGFYSDDIQQSLHIHDFIRKWLVDHAEYKDIPLYISGDSYSGKIVPIIVHSIVNGNKVGLAPKLNLKGYILGNPLTRKEGATISEFKFAKRVSLIPDELYESCKMSCNGSYEKEDAHTEECRKSLEAMAYNLDPLFGPNVLKPKCWTPETLCQESGYQLLVTWANNMRVREILQIRQGTKFEWIRCNKSLPYENNVESVVGYHQILAKEFMSALIYSGDQDMVVPYVGTLAWIKDLNISTTDDWLPWFVDGQIAGYTTKFSNGHYHLTFATVKGAGHTAPEYKRKECLSMIQKWLTT